MDKKLMALLATQVTALTGDQLSWLTGDQLSWLTGDQLRGLTREQLSWLTGDQLRGLTGDQLSWLTGEQVIPVIDRLYTKMFAEIKAETRRLDQSTFGPETAPANICDTPMCVAGHTVNLAGEAGYKLKAALGFAAAARLIHQASSEAPPPRYDNYPSKWALAYIEARAKEEAAAALT